jgi:hypothetical protein
LRVAPAGGTLATAAAAVGAAFACTDGDNVALLGCMGAPRALGVTLLACCCSLARSNASSVGSAGGVATAGNAGTVALRRAAAGSGAGSARTTFGGTSLNCAVSTGARTAGAGAELVAPTGPDAATTINTPTRMRRAIATHGDVREAGLAWDIDDNL